MKFVSGWPMEINNKQVAFVTFIDFLSLTELTLHLEKNKA